MKKVFCDICKKEIKGTVKSLTLTMDMWQITVKGDAHWGEEAIDVCPKCLGDICKAYVESNKEKKGEGK